ncbi:hypothetical protein A3A20_02115 [Candidatus Wolfebacteria bacterium RIFCSPLOWO2_01_FULL_45_19]|uniref:DUF5667 domain-containing protein n=1 Tax=Candidatus Wolfebacteria bacterium RIFCSPLOWO2_01_FULL_45_19 TaxID=1802557 RepID=A0A1F8DV27_9BACT|nr:MAG: hypothetical protein UX23_C0001G0061 [Parcubacteria group bacterium GW2011_GWB1_45_9]OGM91708.1 MAG: hypothetical protein A3A20_02115 [Candidatus Wolfebacteria bacterium RIFCSPLOWO2_01_FULL_45_19]
MNNKIIKISILVPCFLFLVSSSVAFAQEDGSINLPQEEVQEADIFNFVPQLLVKLFADKIEQYAPNNGENMSQTLLLLKRASERVNEFMEQRIGVGLNATLTYIGNTFVWILEFIIRLVRLGMSYL